MPAFTTRAYQADDEASVLALLREVLGGGRGFERSEAFWRWKHFENPFGASLLTLATNGEVLGLRAFMRWEFHDGERTLRAVRAVDTATHPAARRGGVFSRLTAQAVDEARAAGVDLIFNTPNAVSLRGYLKLGWTYVGRLRPLVRVLRPLRIAAALLGRPAPDDHKPAAALPSIADLLAHRGALDSLLAANDRLTGGGLRTARSTGFLRWRYGQAPSLAYAAWWVGPEPAAAAAIVRQNRRRGLRELMISDLLLGPDGPARAAGMVRELARAVPADYMVAHAAGGTPHARALLRAGFLPVPRLGPYFTIRPLSALAAPLAGAGPRAWRLALGDLEVF
ncbi:MAG: GNAT family N-acetyltransferase [Armatimonadota bacterium]|nr:GNAT family N-acetyltransferase [Armatimonadota bacterium]